MNIVLSGINGFMGKEVMTAAEKTGAAITIGIDVKPDPTCPVPTAKTFLEADAYLSTRLAGCVIDFSHHAATVDLVDFAKRNRLPLVIATTGQTEEERAYIEAAAKEIPVFFAANYALGVALLAELAKKTAAAFPNSEIEIVEQHHSRKIDAPSGTALMLANAIKSVRPECVEHCGRSGICKRTPSEIGIHSLRMGNIVGEHEVIVHAGSQSITLKHEAYSRALFAEGALAAAKWLIGKPAGLYTMSDLI